MTIPNRTLPKETTELDCGEFETKGANVTFYYAEGQPDTYFIPGSTLAELQQTVQSWMDDSEGYITVFAIAGGLVCGAMPQ